MRWRSSSLLMDARLAGIGRARALFFLLQGKAVIRQGTLPEFPFLRPPCGWCLPRLPKTLVGAGWCCLDKGSSRRACWAAPSPFFFSTTLSASLRLWAAQPELMMSVDLVRPPDLAPQGTFQGEDTRLPYACARGAHSAPEHLRAAAARADARRSGPCRQVSSSPVGAGGVVCSAICLLSSISISS